MGKVNADKSRVVAPSAETPRSRNESVEKPIPKREPAHASRVRSQRSIEPSPDVSASAKIQQLSEVNRQIRGASTSNPSDVERLAQKRDALLAELDAIASVDVVTQADGTVRVRTQEGNLLVDSLSPVDDGRGDIAPPPPTPAAGGNTQSARPEPAPIASETAAAAYERIETADVATPAPVEGASMETTPEVAIVEQEVAPVSSTLTEVASGQTGIALVDQAAGLEAKVDILNRVELALAESSTALGSVQSRQADVDAILG